MFYINVVSYVTIYIVSYNIVWVSYKYLFYDSVSNHATISNILISIRDHYINYDFHILYTDQGGLIKLMPRLGELWILWLPMFMWKVLQVYCMKKSKSGHSLIWSVYYNW